MCAMKPADDRRDSFESAIELSELMRMADQNPKSVANWGPEGRKIQNPREPVVLEATVQCGDMQATGHTKVFVVSLCWDGFVISVGLLGDVFLR